MFAVQFKMEIPTGVWRSSIKRLTNFNYVDKFGKTFIYIRHTILKRILHNNLSGKKNIK